MQMAFVGMQGWTVHVAAYAECDVDVSTAVGSRHVAMH